MPDLPLVIEPDELEKHLQDDKLLLVDLSRHAQYVQAHVPGAVFLDYNHLTAMKKPAMGLLPDAETLSRALSAIGFDEHKHVVAYDEEGGGKAARLIWTLHALGHFKTSLLNGGLISWYKENHPLSADPVPVTPSDYHAEFKNMDVVADAEYIMQQLERKDFGLLDARSLEEYKGTRRYAERGGHIPGAQRFEWTEGMDPDRNYRLLPVDTLKSKLNDLGLTEDREIVAYCQTHHRSALSYLMLKYMGYQRVRGYHGSWSDWGNRADTPVEQ
jgi:thiosulfate/3-mercaptopyruvate sulfurtransferase